MDKPITGWIIVETSLVDDPETQTWVTLFPTYEKAVKAIQDYCTDNDMSEELALSEWDENADQSHAEVAIADVAILIIQKVTMIGEDDG
jgi:hypothetical protein